MSSINPTPSYIPDPAEAVFREAVRRIHKPWIHDFLYPSDTARPELLQQMLLQPQRKLGKTSITTTVPSDAPTLKEEVRRLLLPAFSIGSLSVGYEILEYVATTVSPCKSPYLARQVREDQHGILFVVAELDTGLTELVLYVQHSPGLQERIVMVLATAPFRSVMDTLAKSDIYDEGMMRRAIVYSMSSRLIRPCPLCSTRSATCSCPLNLLPKEQSVDFDRDLRILSDYKGSFLGECQHRMYLDGVNLFNGVSCVSVTTECSADEAVMRKLDSWAMWDTLHGLENLVTLVMPSAVADSSVRENVAEASCEAGDNDAVISREGCACAQSPSSRSLIVPMNEETERYHSHYKDVWSGQDLRGNTNNYDTAVPHARYDQSHSATASVLFRRTTDRSQSTMFRASAVSSRGHVSAAERERSTQPTGRADQMQMSGIPSRATPSAMHLVPPAKKHTSPFDKQSTTRPKRIGRPPGPERTRMTRVVPIVPATNAIAPTGEKRAPKDSPEAATGTIESRKERNRQSARRSDERRQNEIQAMEANLKEIKKMEAELRQKERDLREANLALKSKLKD